MRSEKDSNTAYAYRLIGALLAVAACAVAPVQPAAWANEEAGNGLVLENDVYRIAVSRLLARSRRSSLSRSTAT